MADTDSLRRFLFEHSGIRGNLVHLDASWRAVLETHPYPDPVRDHLGQALAAVSLLSATIKFEGALILQVQGSGPLRTLVAQMTSARILRGVARWDGQVPAGGTLIDCCGEGRLVLTIERGGGAEPYQGVVPLVGDTLSDALETYFAQSEQLPTRLWLTADEDRVAGLLLQRLPFDAPRIADEEDAAQAWQRVTLLADTLRRQELLSLGARDLLHRLYHEDDIRLFDTEPVAFRCGCSRDRIETLLRVLGEDEVRSIVAEQGAVTVTCEFCNRTWRLDAVDAELVFTPGGRHTGAPSGMTVRH